MIVKMLKTNILSCLLWLPSLSNGFFSYSLWKAHRHASALLPRQAAVAAGDTILVIGSTGGVGQLVTEKLRNRQYKVRITSRNIEQSRKLLESSTSGEHNPVEVVPLDLVKDSPVQLAEALRGSSGVVICVGTTAFPTLKWQGGNTPQAIDANAVSNVVEAASSMASMKKICLVTSVGVYRTDEMPFKILNLFGVLDAKRAGEDALKKASTFNGIDYVIVRPGRLIGGPFTNFDVARLLQIEGGAENGVVVAPGDDLLGDCKRDACAEAIVQALQQDTKNVEFSIVSSDQPALKDREWKELFSSIAK